MLQTYVRKWYNRTMNMINLTGKYKNDCILISISVVGIILITVILWSLSGFTEKADKLVIYYEKAVIWEQELTSGTQTVVLEGKDSTLYINGEKTDTVCLSEMFHVISVSDKNVTMIEADCRDQICVNHKPINRKGESIICLPHKLVVTVQTDQTAQYDAVTW